MSRRLTRKEIKHDEFVERMTSWLHYAQDHARSLIWGAVGLLGLALAVVLVFAYLERRDRQAQIALAKALAVHGAEIVPDGADPERDWSPTFADAASRTARARELFAQVRERYGRSKAAAIATVYLGQMAADAGDGARARELWREFLEARPRDALAAEVRLNLMALDRAEGRGSELVEELRGLIGSGGGELPPDLLWYQLGVTLEELGRQVEADEAFRTLVEQFPQSPFAAAARSRVAGAEAQLFGG